MADVFYVDSNYDVHTGLVKFKWSRKQERFFDMYPGSLSDLHLGQLLLHNVPLPRRVLFPVKNSGNSYSSGSGKGNNLRHVPASVSLVFGGLFIYGFIKFLYYGSERGDYVYAVALIAGFIPFVFSIILIMECFMPEPSPIFWFVVEHISLSSLGL